MLKRQTKAPKKATSASTKVQKKATKKVAPKKTKKVLAASKRTNCSSTPHHHHEDPKKAGVRLGQSTLSAKFPTVAGSKVMPGTLNVEPFNTEADLSKGTVVLFSYPLDFTFVCPTELNEMSANMNTFKEMGVSVFGVSTDSAQAHQTWMRQPIKQGGIEGLQFPLVSDTARDITFAMGSLMPTGFATRATYVLHDGNIKHASFNEPGVGRSAADLIRTVQAIQHNATHGEVCAASFSKDNKKSMKATRDGLIDFLSKESV